MPGKEIEPRQATDGHDSIGAEAGYEPALIDVTIPPLIDNNKHNLLNTSLMEQGAGDERKEADLKGRYVATPVTTIEEPRHTLRESAIDFWRNLKIKIGNTLRLPEKLAEAAPLLIGGALAATASSAGSSEALIGANIAVCSLLAFHYSSILWRNATKRVFCPYDSESRQLPIGEIWSSARMVREEGVFATVSAEPDAMLHRDLPVAAMRIASFAPMVLFNNPQLTLYCLAATEGCYHILDYIRQRRTIAMDWNGRFHHMWWKPGDAYKPDVEHLERVQNSYVTFRETFFAGVINKLFRRDIRIMVATLARRGGDVVKITRYLGESTALKSMVLAWLNDEQQVDDAGGKHGAHLLDSAESDRANKRMKHEIFNRLWSAIRVSKIGDTTTGDVEAYKMHNDDELDVNAAWPFARNADKVYEDLGLLIRAYVSAHNKDKDSFESAMQFLKAISYDSDIFQHRSQRKPWFDTLIGNRLIPQFDYQGATVDNLWRLVDEKEKELLCGFGAICQSMIGKCQNDNERWKTANVKQIPRAMLAYLGGLNTLASDYLHFVGQFLEVHTLLALNGPTGRDRFAPHYLDDLDDEDSEKVKREIWQMKIKTGRALRRKKAYSVIRGEKKDIRAPWFLKKYLPQSYRPNRVLLTGINLSISTGLYLITSSPTVAFAIPAGLAALEFAGLKIYERLSGFGPYGGTEEALKTAAASQRLYGIVRPMFNDVSDKDVTKQRRRLDRLLSTVDNIILVDPNDYSPRNMNRFRQPLPPATPGATIVIPSHGTPPPVNQGNFHGYEGPRAMRPLGVEIALSGGQSRQKIAISFRQDGSVGTVCIDGTNNNGFCDYLNQRFFYKAQGSSRIKVTFGALNSEKQKQLLPSLYFNYLSGSKKSFL